MFQATHLLVSRTRKTPVMLVPNKQGMSIFTEPEWQQGVTESAFEFRPKQGFFCKRVSITGYSLQPIQVEQTAANVSPNASVTP